MFEWSFSSSNTNYYSFKNLHWKWVEWLLNTLWQNFCVVRCSQIFFLAMYPEPWLIVDLLASWYSPAGWVLCLYKSWPIFPSRRHLQDVDDRKKNLEASYFCTLQSSLQLRHHYLFFVSLFALCVCVVSLSSLSKPYMWVWP